MKATNHHKDNYTFDDSNDGSVMNGTIYMTTKEYHKVLEYLRKAYTNAKAKNNTYIRDGLSHVFNWTLVKRLNLKRICLGVTATELIFKHYKLPRYKRQNYVIEIK